MASSAPLRSSFGRVLLVLAASSLFACTISPGTMGTGDSPEVVVLVEHPRAAPQPSLADFERDMLAFSEVCAAPTRFPLALTVLPFDPSAPLAAGGPGRCSVTPGRAASIRQTVPARSRRKLRTWERDAAA